MLPLQSLLNPASPNSSPHCSRKSIPALISASALEGPAAVRSKMDARQTLGKPDPRSTASPLKSRTQGPVRFPPFEHVSAQVMQEIATYQISPFGQIQQCCEHIPYNSSKKNFYEKTGRESIEAFKYEFRVPGQQITYKVMWDYNIGLVRMTPFFKCLGYPKPSQMLDKNPGLREISPSITGGSVSAQGYWMPYRCARAVCATFCHDIAGALIPLFGPQFPLECTPPSSQFFGEMVINHRLVVEAKMEAEASRHVYESRKDAVLNGSASLRRPEAGAFPRSIDRAHSWLGASPRPSARAVPRIANDNPSPNPVPLLRGEANTETGHARFGSEAGLPPINHASRELQLHQHTYRVPAPESPKGPLLGPVVATKPWVVKRRRSDQDNDSTRTKAAKVGAGFALPQNREAGHHARKGKNVRSAGEDYAAAAVLVGLQTTGVGAAADSVAVGYRDNPPP